MATRLLYRTCLRQVAKLRQSGCKLFVLQSPVDPREWGRFRYPGEEEAGSALLKGLLPESLLELLIGSPTVDELTSTTITPETLAELVRVGFRAGIERVQKLESAGEAAEERQALEDSGFEALRHLMLQITLFQCCSITDTQDIRVTVTATAVKGSRGQRPGEQTYCYRVSVQNLSSREVQLQGRYWRFVDAEDGVIEVPKFETGVVGQQPWLRPGQRFTYVSGCDLAASPGTMEGAFQMAFEGENNPFEAIIGQLDLRQP